MMLITCNYRSCLIPLLQIPLLFLSSSQAVSLDFPCRLAKRSEKWLTAVKLSVWYEFKSGEKTVPVLLQLTYSFLKSDCLFGIYAKLIFFLTGKLCLKKANVLNKCVEKLPICIQCHGLIKYPVVLYELRITLFCGKYTKCHCT